MISHLSALMLCQALMDENWTVYSTLLSSFFPHHSPFSQWSVQNHNPVNVLRRAFSRYNHSRGWAPVIPEHICLWVLDVLQLCLQIQNLQTHLAVQHFKIPAQWVLKNLHWTGLSFRVTEICNLCFWNRNCSYRMEMSTWLCFDYSHYKTTFLKRFCFIRYILMTWYERYKFG